MQRWHGDEIPLPGFFSTFHTLHMCKIFSNRLYSAFVHVSSKSYRPTMQIAQVSGLWRWLLLLLCFHVTQSRSSRHHSSLWNYTLAASSLWSSSVVFKHSLELSKQSEWWLATENKSQLKILKMEAYRSQWFAIWGLKSQQSSCSCTCRITWLLNSDFACGTICVLSPCPTMSAWNQAGLWELVQIQRLNPSECASRVRPRCYYKWLCALKPQTRTFQQHRN